jgi:hypothetical protein
MTNWSDQEAEVNNIRDCLGKPVDQGIRETVIVLNVLDFVTCGSCEGHVDWGMLAPWVDFRGERGKEAARIFRQAVEAQAAGQSRDHVDALCQKAHALKKEAERPMLEKALLLGRHLDDFYRGRQVPFDTRLVIEKYTSRVRLINQGAIFQSVRDAETRAQKLTEYQQEMRDFTLFLKAVYLQTEKS